MEEERGYDNIIIITPIKKSYICITYLDLSSGHPVFLHEFYGGGSAVDHEWFQFTCPYQLDGLNYNITVIQRFKKIMVG